MSTTELTEKVLAVVRGNDAAIQQLSAALLSHDAQQIKTVFHSVAGVDFSADEMDTILREFGTEEQIAACT